MGVKNRLFYRKYTQKSGFLLIEAMMALSVALVFSFVIAYVQSQASLLLYEGNAYCKATNAAQRIFERISGNPRVVPPNLLDGMDIQVFQDSLYDKVPYKQVRVEVSWLSAHGITKKTTFSGGIIDEA